MREDNYNFLRTLFKQKVHTAIKPSIVIIHDLLIINKLLKVLFLKNDNQHKGVSAMSKETKMEFF